MSLQLLVIDPKGGRSFHTPRPPEPSTREEVYLTLAKRWAKGAAILFAVGAVSGTVLSFELGLLWHGFMGHAGAIIGMPLMRLNGLKNEAAQTPTRNNSLTFTGRSLRRPQFRSACGYLIFTGYRPKRC